MQNFVGDIADSLYSWSINNNYLPNNFTEYDTNDSNNYDGLREYLGKLAWTGLKNTTKGNEYYNQHEGQISIYYEAAKVNSTKTIDCN